MTRFSSDVMRKYAALRRWIDRPFCPPAHARTPETLRCPIVTVDPLVVRVEICFSQLHVLPNHSCLYRPPDGVFGTRHLPPATIRPCPRPSTSTFALTFADMLCHVNWGFRVFCSDGGGSGEAAGTGGFGFGFGSDLDFEVEYRWERLPEEDEQAGVWLVFAASLALTIFLAVDTCNGTAGGDGGSDWDDGRVGGAPPPSSSSSSLGRTGHGEEGARARRVGGGGGALGPGGGEERRRRR